MSDGDLLEQQGPRENPVDAQLQKAVRYLEIERYDMAERALHEALQLEPDNPWVHLLLARTLYAADRYEDAEQVARDTLALAPEFAAGHCILGSVLVQLGRHAEAERCFLEGLRHDPEDETLFLVYGGLLYRTGHLDKAEKLLRRSLELDPESEEAHGALAGVLAAKKERAEGRRHAAHGVSLAPESDFSHFMQGQALLAGGRPFAARGHLREALRLDPADSDNEQAFLTADRCCRWTYLPMYWWALLVDRLPGKQFLIWGAFVLSLPLMDKLGVPAAWRHGVVLFYLGLVIYTWVADPLTSLWIKLVPPK